MSDITDILHMAKNKGEFWRVKSERAEIELADLRKKAATLTEWEDYKNKVIVEQCANDEEHCACVPALRKELDDMQVDWREFCRLAFERHCGALHNADFEVCGDAICKHANKGEQ